MTGARFPLAFFGGPFDACVKVEDTVIVKGPDGTGTYIQIKKPATRHQNWRFQGSDFNYEDPVVCQGMTIKPHHVMALAMLGVEEIDVYRRLRVGVISTGSELVPHNNQIGPDASQIRDNNSPYIQAVLERLGVEVVSLGIVGDNPAEFQAMLSTCVTQRKFDVIFSTGAVSMGKYDFVGAAIQAMGANIKIHRTGIRPGSLVLFATLPTQMKVKKLTDFNPQPGDSGPTLDQAFFGLPGNPLATAVCLRFLVIPYLSVMQKVIKTRPQTSPIPLSPQP